MSLINSQETTSAEYETYFSKLEGSFKDSMNIIVNDPIMECFRENKESQLFMFERIKEVITQSLQEAQDEYNREALQRIDDMRSFTSSLKEEIRQLNSVNKSLKEKLKKKSGNKEQELEQGKSLMIEKVKLETEMEEIKSNFESLRSKLSDAESLLNWKEDVIKKLEDSIDHLQKNEKDQLRKIEELNLELKKAFKNETDLKSELEAEREKNQIRRNEVEEIRHCKECDSYSQRLRMQNRELQELRLAKEDLEKIKNHDFKNISQNCQSLEKALEDKNKILATKDQKIEDLEFTVKQLEQTISSFKYELTESTKRVREERKHRHSIEINMIELKDSFSELSLEIKGVRDENQKSKQEV